MVPKYFLTELRVPVCAVILDRMNRIYLIFFLIAIMAIVLNRLIKDFRINEENVISSFPESIQGRSLVVFPGGFGTLDELFETLTLVQTRKIEPIPILLFGKAFWQSAVHFDTLVEEGTISPEDLDIFRYVETAEEAWEFLRSIDPDLHGAGNG